MSNFLFIWGDYNMLEKCSRIPECKLTLEQMRKSIGFEENQETGMRIYFVPIE